MNERYVRNMTSFSERELQLILTKRICIVGCGGLGGHVIQSLARFGVGELALVDGDSFCTSNLNRQVFATEQNLGQNKALAAMEAVASINSAIPVTAHAEMLNEQNAQQIFSGHHLVFDCLDSIPARYLLMHQCSILGIPFIHGAIGGFFGQVCSIFPGDKTLERVYPVQTATGIEQTLGNPAFTPQLVAALQCCEGLKILAGREPALRKSVLRIDLLSNEMDLIPVEP